MSVLRKYTVIVPVSLCIAFLVTACNDSKAAQCQRLIEVLNKGTNLIEKNKGQQVITSMQLAKDLEAVTKDLKQLNLKDPELQDYQNRFVKMFENFSQSFAKAGKALSAAKTAQASSEGRLTVEKTRGDIDTALTSAANVAKQSDITASKLNKYCNQPE